MIVVDPSCSASGTFNNKLIENHEDVCCLETAGGDLEETQIERLKKLAMFQIKILNHAMSFPNVEMISYSTCSIFMTEDEYVVEKVLSENPNFSVRKMKHSFHDGVTEGASNCIRTCMKCHNLEGFFIAIFEKR